MFFSAMIIYTLLGWLKNIDNRPSKPCGGPSTAEYGLTRRVFGHMLFQFFAPEGLKRSAASIKCVNFGKFGVFATKITPFDAVGCNTRVFFQCIVH